MTRMEEYAFTKADKALPSTPVKTIRGTFDSTWKDQLLTWNGVSMTYDAIGNMVKKGNTTYTWTQGRKLSTVNNGKKIQYFYDHTGRRARKTVDGVITDFRMAGELLMSQKAGDVTTYFSYDSAGNLIGMSAGRERYFYTRNAQNDITGLIDENGTSVVQYQYDSWGKLLGITGSLASTIGKRNPFRYRGYYYDDETGMYYLQSRYYDPEIKRFICADRQEVLTEVPSALGHKNLFNYCDNNPVVRLDIEGDIWETVLDIVSLGASIVEVATTPGDPLAWAGLAGDVADVLIPCVGGIGEAIKATPKVIRKADNVIDAAKTTYHMAEASSPIRKATGSYEILFANGYNYVGKGGFKRAIVSAKLHETETAPAISISWKSAPDSRTAFIDEYLMQKKQKVKSEPKHGKTYNKIWSPGRRYYEGYTLTPAQRKRRKRR